MPKQFLIGFLTLLILLLCQATAALDPTKRFDQYVIDTWSIEQGLPQITVSAILQDRDHYLWVATQAGLARFDGVQFRTYSADNTPAIRGNFIQDLLLDRQGQLWIATYKGLTRKSGETFFAVDIANAEKSAQININALSEGQSGEIWVAANEGIYVVKEHKLHLVQSTDQPNHDILTFENKVYVGTVGKLWLYEGSSLNEIELPDYYQQATINESIYYQDKIWLGTNKGLLILDPKTQKIVEFKTQSKLFHYPVDALGADSEGNLWVGTISGFYRIHGMQVTDFTTEKQNQDFKQVQAIFEDHEGNLWLGSYTDGIARVWSGRTLRFSADAGLQDPLVWSVAPSLSGDAVWVGTNRGLALLQDGKFSTWATPNQLPHPTVYTLLPENNQLWIGTRKGLTRLVNGEINTPAHNEIFSSLQINSIFRDQQKQLWVGTSDGLYQYSEQEVTKIPTNSQQNILVRPVTQLRDGRIWVGTQKGLFEVSNERLSPIGLENGLNDTLDVTAILELYNGDIIIATLSQGLFIKHNGLWHQLTERDGLPVNESFTLVKDQNEVLWVSGFKGLYQVPIEQLIEYLEKRRTSFSAYMLLSESGGIIGSQKSFCCNGAGNAKGFFKEGLLWYPSRDGVVLLDTRQIQLNPIPPQLKIERFFFDGTWHSISQDRVQLQQDQRDIAIDFTALSFRDPKSVQFQYRLIGYQDGWKMLDSKSQRRVNYTNLPPGNYTFAVKASNNAGVWNSEPAEFQFSIKPYYYESLWFYIVCIIIAGMLVSLWHKLRLRALKEKKIELEEKIKQHTAQLEVSNQKLQEAVSALKEASHTDQLSGLRNRRYLNSQLPSDLSHFEREFERLKTTGPMIFMLADIDHFKQINDQYGHNAGDNIIKVFSDEIRKNIREGDYAVRWGGEEFLVVFRPMPSAKSCELVERIRHAIECQSFAIDEKTSIKVTCSIGFSAYPFFEQEAHALTWEQTVELADHALYFVKQNGRNGWACFQPTEKTQVNSTIISQIKENLGQLVANEQIQIKTSIPS
ncbi:diguanylate cyclase [Pleionea litopenaei]|uniref:diguanylate cyclase n=1 Tax=Pleionea litopenaei TaxID=3070815 RepID=A0AA51X5I8_9GAMM|nr:diguanylate cyclase [Pleionea sp. HL-JVS1]WMS85661.1 diguanylate cyclase [Pleionea sp. HL-JVS1]